jgi:acetyltransferase-like isoleucine patch superfamily enzyme
MIQTLKAKFTKSFRKYILGILHDKFVDNKPNYQISGNVTLGFNCSIRERVLLLATNNGQLVIGNHTYIGKDVEIGATLITIGDYTSLQDRDIILGDVEIQRYCIFAPNVYISSGNHYYGLKPTWNIKDQDEYVQNDIELSKQHSQKVIVEEDCWIGINSVVMRGVTIRKGTVVGANSVVTKDTEPYSVVVGSPAKIIKRRIEFKPPTSIEYNNEVDLPYFYMGFITHKIEREKSREEMRGIIAMKHFKIALQCKNTIHLVIKTLNSKECILIYQHQRVIISREYQTYIFKVTNDTNIHEFFIEQIGNEIILVQKAWSF